MINEIGFYKEPLTGECLISANDYFNIVETLLDGDLENLMDGDNQELNVPVA